MKPNDRVKLLFGPYQAPPLKRGDRAMCLFRDCDVVILGWSNGRIPWPRCKVFGRRGGSGILVNEELARAVRHESAAAVGHWWGVCALTIVRWRRALGVNRTNSEGSQRLIRDCAERGGAAFKERGFTDAEKEHFRQRALELNLGQYLQVVPAGGLPVWTPHEIKQLGTARDAEVARRIGRTLQAVRTKRLNEGIPPLGRPPNSPN
jgi:hypothetical protein